MFIIWGKIFHCFGLTFKFLYILSFFPEIILQGIQPCEVLRVLIFHPAKGILRALFQLAWFRNLILMTSVMAMTAYYFITSNAGRFLNSDVNFNFSIFLPFFFELFF